MFGYVRARQDTLSNEAAAEYEAVYCGICRALGRRYGNFTRLFLNYDFAMLAMLLAPTEQPGACGCERCFLHPVCGKPSCGSGAWLETASGESVILTYWKLQDTAIDGVFFARVGARFLRLCLRGGYRRARADFPDFDLRVSKLLKELRELEKDCCPSIDQTADCFARILQAAAPSTGNGPRDRATGQLLYHLGRWIYLIDAVDDLEEDQKAGRYNPVAARFPGWNETDRAYLRHMMDHTLSLAGAAFQLLEENAWSSVVENILYSGLPGVEELVFSGQWREYQKRHRRKDL